MTTEPEKYILCVNCRATFSEAEVKGWGCSACGNKGMPADTRQKSTATLTDHEWRILTIWADNWARKVCAKDPSEGTDPVACITAIINEIHRQSPSLSGLTMSEQVQELADHLGSEVEQHADGERTTIKPAKRH